MKLVADRPVDKFVNKAGERDSLERTNKVAARTHELLAGHYSQPKPANVMEALAEINDTQIAVIAEFMKLGDTAGLGGYVYRMIKNYNEGMVNEVVEYPVDEEMKCQRCEGMGCRKCLEDY